jgi:hypothetical protein
MKKVYSHGDPIIFGLTALGYFETMTLKSRETIWEQPSAIHKAIIKRNFIFIKIPSRKEDTHYAFFLWEGPYVKGVKVDSHLMVNEC